MVCKRLKNAELRRFIAFSIISSSLVVAIVAYLPFLQKMNMVNLKDAGGYLDSVKAERIEVFTVPSTETIVNIAVAVPILDLYTGKDIYYSHDETYAPPFEEIKESPLRFTWEYKNPRYYSDENNIPPAVRRGGVPPPLQPEPLPLVIISNGNVKPLPDYVAERAKGYRGKKVFDISDGVFGFSPIVTVYLPTDENP